MAALAILILDGLPGAAPPIAKAHAGITTIANTGPARNYDELLAKYASALEQARRQARDRPREWLVHEQHARAAYAYARLSGSYEEYALAQRALDRAFRSAAPGMGPHFSQAALHLSMHRLDRAERMLGAVDNYAVPPDAGERADMLGMRGEIAFYRADYAGALSQYDAADRLVPNASDFRRAIFHSKTGRADLAALHFDRYERALVRPDRHVRANLRLQRGILDLDAGRWREALAHFEAADAVFPGWWLVEEHIAETRALLGDAAGAEQLYRRIVARTGAPEFMDALAALLAARGETHEAEQLRRRSAAIWDRRLLQFPEASYGHALDHCTAFGRTECALRLARRNHAARRYGEAGEQLASALADAGRMEEARAAVDRVLATPWRTAPLFATASRIYQALGAAEAADTYRRRALALNPRIFS